MKNNYYLKKWLLIILIIPFSSLVKAQSDSLWHYSAEAQALVAPSGKLPFWFRADQGGSIPLAGTSGSLIGSVYRDYDTTRKSFVYWSAGAQVRTNMGNKAYLTLIEGYIKIKKGVFELTGGRTRDIIGLVDSSLSSGAFSLSGNALGIPKISLAIPDYYSLPVFNKLFSFKGSFSYGWIGDIPVYNEKNLSIKNDTVKYLQTSLYVQIGRPGSHLKLIGGINHNVMYGDERRTFNLQLTKLGTFLYAATGKTYASLSKVGNHLGSIDAGLQYAFPDVQLLAYHQFIYDVGAIGHLANLPDGISGISLTNHKANSGNAFRWTKLLLEFIYTKDQAGAYGDKVKSGDEDYYNNFEYIQGWTYHGINLGNPLLTSRQYIRAGQANDPDDFIIDNRIIAVNTGFQGYYKQIGITARLTYSQNYGTYGTNYPGHSTGGVYTPPAYGIFVPVRQLSGYLEGSKALKNGWSTGAALAFDQGKLYYNSAGILLKLKKSFN